MGHIQRVTGTIKICVLKFWTNLEGKNVVNPLWFSNSAFYSQFSVLALDDQLTAWPICNLGHWWWRDDDTKSAYSLCHICGSHTVQPGTADITNHFHLIHPQNHSRHAHKGFDNACCCTVNMGITILNVPFRHWRIRGILKRFKNG